MARVMLLLAVTTPGFAQDWIKHERIDVTPSGGAPSTFGVFEDAAVSNNGRWVIFSSDQNDLLVGNNNDHEDVFVRDRATQTTHRLIDNANTCVYCSIGHPVATGNARFVSFVSNYPDLVPDDQNDKADVFLLDRDSDHDGEFDEAGGTLIQRVSLDETGAEFFPGAEDVRPAVSEDGNSVAFSSSGILDGSDTNGAPDVFLRALNAATTTAMSTTASGTVGNDASPGFFSPPLRINANARFVAFSSEASDLVAADTNQETDVFVHDVFAWSRRSGQLVRITDYPIPQDGDDGYLGIPIALSANGVHALILIRSAGPAYDAQAGLYLYTRNIIFRDGFEPAPTP